MKKPTKKGAGKRPGAGRREKRHGAERISVSLPPEVARGLDEFSAERGFDNRSQALAWMIREHLRVGREEAGDSVMAGSVTLFFNQTRPGIMEELAKLKREFVDEVIGTLQVQLTDDHLMEVLLVQGPVPLLRRLTDRIVACKGVKAGRLALTSEIIPPVHPLPSEFPKKTANKKRV